MARNTRYEFSKRLQNLVGSNLIIRINNNRSTMVHVRKDQDHTNVSLHRMFVKAPKTIQRALAHYIRREDAAISPSVEAFISKHIAELDHSHLFDEISTKGSTYNLKTLYSRVNRRYFNNEMRLRITWFGDPTVKFRTKCTFGLYYDTVKLVKIHRLLDNPHVPAYVVEYVIYHEMLHALCPAYVDENGRNCIHSREFKELERNFREFEHAQNWLKIHRMNFFASQRVYTNGRTQQMGKHQASKR